jgi:hypothetical protein
MSLLRILLRPLAGAGVVLALVALATLRQLAAGAESMRDATAMAEGGDVEGAIRAARRAAEAIVPGSPYPAQAYGLLEAIAERAEARGDGETALAAWHAARGASVATRSPFVRPHPVADRSSEAIARLAASPPGARTNAPAEPDPRIQELLARAAGPDGLAPLVLAAGAMLLLIGGVGATWLAAHDASRQRVFVAFAVAIVGVALYVAGGTFG